MTNLVVNLLMYTIIHNFMIMVALFAVLFAVLFASVLVPSYSEYISPKKQLEQGVSSEDIQCNAGKVLATRDNGKIVCVKESTADKKNWDIIATEFAPDNNNSTAKNNTLLSREELREMTEYNTHIELNHKTAPFDRMKHIANPGGYWVPIVNKDVFVEKFLNAVDDELAEIKETSAIQTEYRTKDGVLTISPDSRHLNGFTPSVNYLSADTAYDRQSQMEYVNNFMNKMGFKVNGNDVSLSESFIDSCLEVWSGYSCSKFNAPFLISIDSWDKYNTDYYFKGEQGDIKFIFYNKAFFTYSAYGINIKFNGWSNYPELVRGSLDDLKTNKSIIDPETAKSKALEFSETYYAEYLIIRDDPRVGCVWKLHDEERRWAAMKVVSGVPFYKVKLGHCLTYYSNGELSSYRLPYFMVDAWDGDLIYVQYALVGG